MDFPDLHRAVWRVPLHLLLSIPVAAAAAVVPPAGKAYIHWRERAETADLATGRDSAAKSAVDLYSQTALVRATLTLWKRL